MDKVLQSIISAVNVNDNVVAGISGGADSMVLLNLLIKAKQIKSFKLTAVHIEHGIRAEEAKRDALFVQDYCKKHKVTCKIISADIPKLAKQKKQTLEECARNFRYQQFYKAMGTSGKIFIAHNKNDQAETVLMHIFRGSGISGAAGIKQTDVIFRPLLCKTKAEILHHAKTNNIPFVQDSTNENTDYSRNFVRNKVLSQIEEVYPAVVENIAKFAGYASECEDLINSLINLNWFGKTHNSVSVDAFSANKLVVKKVIEKAYNNCGEYSDLESKHIQMVLDLINLCKNGSVCNLPHGVIVEKRQNEVFFYKQTNKIEHVYPFAIGENILPNGKKTNVTLIAEDQVEFGNGCYYVDYHKVPANAVWRTRNNGDYFARLGSGKKKLNDYFTDKKLPTTSRDNAVLLASGNNVLVVLGEDISENVKIDSHTLQIAKIEF